jgi:hypothetical protein
VIKITVTNIDKWVAFLKTVPVGAKKIAARVFTQFMVAVLTLKSYPEYRYVTRKSAYGYTFKSAKQRRWFWANGGPAMIGNHRTGAIGNGWQMSGGGNDRYTITNNVPGVGYVMGNQQANQPRLVGWRTAYDLIRDNFSDGIAAAQAAVMAWIGSK